MGARMIFSRGGQIRGSGDKIPPVESRGGAPVGSDGEAPRSRQKLWKWCKNNWSTERFTAQTLYNISRAGRI